MYAYTKTIQYIYIYIYKNPGLVLRPVCPLQEGAEPAGAEPAERLAGLRIY